MTLLPLSRTHFLTNARILLDWRETERAPDLATGVVDNTLLRSDPLTGVGTNTLRF